MRNFARISILIIASTAIVSSASAHHPMTLEAVNNFKNMQQMVYGAEQSVQVSSSGSDDFNRLQVIAQAMDSLEDQVIPLSPEVLDRLEPALLMMREDLAEIEADVVAIDNNPDLLAPADRIEARRILGQEMDKLSEQISGMSNALAQTLWY
jgi:hypothetical protein